MRLSTDPSDHGYFEFCAGAVAHVLLDGKEVPDVVTVDEERGIVVVYVRNARGELEYDAARDRLRTATRCGRVRIVFEPHAMLQLGMPPSDRLTSPCN